MPNVSNPSTRHVLLSQTAEHALRATLFLARAGSHLVSAADIATALGTPPNYTGKILRRLARTGLLRSVRGPHGGFALRVDARDLSVSEVLRALGEPVEARQTCLLGDRPCDASNPCRAHARWTELEERVATLLDQTTIEELLGAER